LPVKGEINGQPSNIEHEDPMALEEFFLVSLSLSRRIECGGPSTGCVGPEMACTPLASRTRISQFRMSKGTPATSLPEVDGSHA